MERLIGIAVLSLFSVIAHGSSINVCEAPKSDFVEPLRAAADGSKIAAYVAGEPVTWVLSSGNWIGIGAPPLLRNPANTSDLYVSLRRYCDYGDIVAEISVVPIVIERRSPPWIVTPFDSGGSAEEVTDYLCEFFGDCATKEHLNKEEAL